jgi:hypothetical protein
LLASRAAVLRYLIMVWLVFSTSDGWVSIGRELLRARADAFDHAHRALTGQHHRGHVAWRMELGHVALTVRLPVLRRFSSSGRGRPDRFKLDQRP